jgi:hypothetical protein
VLLLVSMKQCCLSMRCWLWYEVVRCRGLSKGCFGKIPSVWMGLWTIWKGTSWYDVGKWSDGKGARGMMWVGNVSHLRKVMLESAKDRF